MYNACAGIVFTLFSLMLSSHTVKFCQKGGFFFFYQFMFSKEYFLIEDIKQDHYLGIRTDVTFKTLNTDQFEMVR